MKAMKIRLHPRSERVHAQLRQVFGTVRWTYNQCVKTLRESTQRQTKKSLRALIVNDDSPAVAANPWLKEVGYDIRDDAIKDFLTGMKGNWTKLKNGTQSKFLMRFRSKKHLKSETFYVRHRWITQKKNTIVIALPKMKKVTLWTGTRAWRGDILMDCKLQRTWNGEYYLCVPHGYRVDNQDPDKNSQSLRVCSLDPGVRTFQTIYDPTNGCALHVGHSDMRRVVRLCVELDKLCSKRDKATQSKKRCSYKRAARRLSARIQNLVNEVHKQLAKHLAINYDLVMIPKFETSQMIRRENRKIGSQTVRQMARWAHYRFRERLLFKCRQHNCQVAIVDEAYTSKTCSCCGTLNHALGGNKVYKCPSAACGAVIDRDINGAKNIFLKNYEALALRLALGPTPSPAATLGCTEPSGVSQDFENF